MNGGVLGEPRTAVLLCVGRHPQDWSASLRSLRGQSVDVVALLEPGYTLQSGDDVELVCRTSTLDGAARSVVAAGCSSLVVVTSPVVFPPDALAGADELLARDVRVATVSFLSNHASYLSFPVRCQPSPLVINGHNEVSLTERLRAIPFRDAAVPIPVPAGGAVYVSAAAVRACGGFDPDAPSAEVSVIEFALRAARRGFTNLLDPTTFVTRPMQPRAPLDALVDEKPRAWLEQRHPSFPSLFDQESQSRVAPVAQAIDSRRAYVLGLRVAMDAGALGPYEMGTQVAILGQIQALIDDPRIAKLYVGTPWGRVPDYARRVLSDPKIVVCDEAGGRFDGVEAVDIVHRPFQPTGPLPFDRWRALGHRTFITIQDLIAYENGHYFGTPEEWLAYRDAMAAAIEGVDAVIAISHDTAEVIARSRLPIAPGAISVIENGTDHLAPGRERPVPPDLVMRSGLLAQRFIVVLGASYAHKNRDLVVRAWTELRRRGSDLQLILAGAIVPYGSTRNEEADALMGADDSPLVLADVTSAERDWLLEHAAVVAYPSSAEGFGLVPFEAAIFGTPSLFVGFGPLAEILPEVPVLAESWDPVHLADGIEELASNPSAAEAQVRAVRSVAHELTWKRYSSRLIDAYLAALFRPPLHR